jgi:spermidine synthase
LKRGLNGDIPNIVSWNAALEFCRLGRFRRMKILQQYDDGNRQVRVIELMKDGGRLYYDGGMLYTHVDENGDNCLDYIAAMDRALGAAEDVLLLGTAGGALATQIRRRGGRVTAVDDWAPAFDIARRWFHLPEDTECVHADAVAYLRSTQRRWNAVAVDVFRGSKIPAVVLTGDIGDLLRKVLTPGGLAVWNVADAPLSWSAQWIARALRHAGFAPAMTPVLDGDVGNTLVICRRPADND